MIFVFAFFSVRAVRFISDSHYLVYDQVSCSDSQNVSHCYTVTDYLINYMPINVLLQVEVFCVTACYTDLRVVRLSTLLALIV